MMQILRDIRSVLRLMAFFFVAVMIMLWIMFKAEMAAIKAEDKLQQTIERNESWKPGIPTRP